MTDAAAPSAAPDAADAPRRPPRVSPRTLAIAVTAAVAAVLVILFVWRLPPFATTLQVTENAYVRGQVTVMAPQVSGYVVEVAVQDFDHVRQGQLLARIDERIYRQRVEQARATLAAREADLSNLDQAERARTAAVAGREAEQASAQAQAQRARADLARIEDLARDGSVSLRERDQAVATLRQTEAAVRQSAAGGEIARQDVRSVAVSREGLKAAAEAARAALRLAQIDLDNTAIRAPRDGQLGEVSVRLGQYVTAGTQLMALVPARLWVTANYKEGQTARMAVGQPVTFTVDALGKRQLRGVVEDLAPATGSEFSVLRPENATGNFVKVAQRIPVKIAISPNQPLAARLRPGMSVVTKVDTRGGR
ncbi:HlyD family secretion protein [uncultured Caulobacter sp.]|uniref:HlyD family secretion protein n=1 Tax=uncultured Caulobacter sp. TaxID=158749 RepID=UPI00262F837D|nr:HlyD family secretion protein [uncultured Caulobacter sp.]